MPARSAGVSARVVRDGVDAWNPNKPQRMLRPNARVSRGAVAAGGWTSASTPSNRAVIRHFAAARSTRPDSSDPPGTPARRDAHPRRPREQDCRGTMRSRSAPPSAARCHERSRAPWFAVPRQRAGTPGQREHLADTRRHRASFASAQLGSTPIVIRRDTTRSVTRPCNSPRSRVRRPGPSGFPWRRAVACMRSRRVRRGTCDRNDLIPLARRPNAISIPRYPALRVAPPRTQRERTPPRVPGTGVGADASPHPCRSGASTGDASPTRSGGGRVSDRLVAGLAGRARFSLDRCTRCSPTPPYATPRVTPTSWVAFIARPPSPKSPINWAYPGSASGSAWCASNAPASRSPNGSLPRESAAARSTEIPMR